MKKLFLITCLVVVASMAQANANSWQPKLNKNGIKVMQQATKTGHVITRGTVEMDATMDAIISVIMDNAACQRWLHDCKESKLVEQISPHSRIDYVVVDLPFFYKDRDMYTFTELSYDKKTQTAMMRISGRENHGKPEAGRVRIKDLQGYWQLRETSAGNTTMVYQIYTDPQIAPSGILHNHLADSVYQTIAKIGKISAEPKYKNAQLAELN